MWSLRDRGYLPKMQKSPFSFITGSGIFFTTSSEPSITHSIKHRELGDFITRNKKKEVEKAKLKHECIIRESHEFNLEKRLQDKLEQTLIKHGHYGIKSKEILEKEKVLIFFILKGFSYLVVKKKIDSINLEKLKNTPDGKDLLQKTKTLITALGLDIKIYQWIME